mmetsp:Transcript_4558/g.11497  ORF Transcript_4558/g.11497 Transcript_4558/m.11497 type:complete len:310 (-) Transcript_4558:242-1171(-)
MSMPHALHALSSGSNMRGAGVGCRRSSAWLGNARRMASALATLANNIISSTMWLASRVTYMPTSSGSLVSLSSSKRTSGDASVSAPASMRRRRSARAHRLMARRSRVSGAVSAASSMSACASAYVSAAELLMTALVKRGAWPGAGSPVSRSKRKNTLKVRRSTPPRSEQMSSVSGLGSMSRRRCTRYVVVPRRHASRSMAVPGSRNELTSAMCTPSSRYWVPSAATTSRHDSASSMSRHPGGSTLHTRSARRSSRCGCSVRCSRSWKLHGSGGTQACTAGAKGRSSTSASSSTAAVSASASPSLPRLRT